ncbi:MAG: PDDEXK nuclease domain-containing protein [Candidatus Cloacimonetes bacterium]|nr:PDDEXK nuclease domain-containing protein [Candidatus Cloacimonadota bacterium]
MINIQRADQILFKEVSQLIEQTKERVALEINAELSLLYWSIGKMIQVEILKHQKAKYGDNTISILSEQLTRAFGKGWSDKQLRHCLRSAETFPDEEKFYVLSRKLSWTHIRTLMYIKDELKRDFYTELCIHEQWSSRQLRERIDSQLFERTAISRKPEETLASDLQLLRQSKRLSPELSFRDPYLLDFLGLEDKYSERDLESAILAELQHFILEFGHDFAFMERQKRITIDSEDYYIDLLFYHRSLRCLVAIELKLGNFKAAYKGQMELYLRYLEKNEMRKDENPPIGLLLCSGKNEEHIELMQLNQGNIRVAEYITKTIPKGKLMAKLQSSIELARKKLDYAADNDG